MKIQQKQPCVRRFRHVLCRLRRHSYITRRLAVIDLFGDDYSEKVVACETCGFVEPSRHNRMAFDSCVNEPDAKAYQRIMDVGLDAYRKERVDEGGRIYGYRTGQPDEAPLTADEIIDDWERLV